MMYATLLGVAQPQAQQQAARDNGRGWWDDNGRGWRAAAVADTTPKVKVAAEDSAVLEFFMQASKET